MKDFLFEQFPDQVQVGDTILDVNTDFRVGLQIMSDFEDPQFDQEARAVLMLKRLYANLPEDREPEFYMEALAQGTKFLNSGDETPPETAGKPRIYSFSKDAKLIYSAFSQTHGIDLQTAEMHWWKFMALFMDLGADTAFNSLVNLRSRAHENKLTDDEKAFIAKMGDMFYLDTPDTEDVLDEDELAFIALLPEEDQKRFWEGRKQ